MCSAVQVSQFPNFSIGIGGRGGSPLAAGGSGRNRFGIRVRGENTSFSWSAGTGWGAAVSNDGLVLGGERGGALSAGRTDCSGTSAGYGTTSTAGRRGTSTGRGSTSGCSGGTMACRGGRLSTGTERVSVRPGVGTSAGARRASASRTRASADFSLPGSLVAVVSTFCLRGGNVLPSLPALCASFASGASRCVAGCSSAAAAEGGVG